MQARAETEMQLDTANQAKRIMETELERYKQQVRRFVVCVAGSLHGLVLWGRVDAVL